MRRATKAHLVEEYLPEEYLPENDLLSRTSQGIARLPAAVVVQADRADPR